MRKVGIGSRVVNFVVDTIIIFGLSYGAFSIHKFYVTYYTVSFVPFYIFFWATLFVYYLIIESIFKRTPGKLLSMSKVVRLDGKKPTFGQVFIRSLLRLTIIDCFFIPFVDDTLHDYVSKTTVVEV